MLFETVGLIAAVGDSVSHLNISSPAAIMSFGGYAEITMVPSKHILPVARLDPEVVAMLTSGLTASISLEKVLKKEFPKGVDIVYESVGGQMFNLCLNALAIYGRLLVIGMISQYQGEQGWKPLNYAGICEKLLAKSQTLAGFFLNHYAHLWQQHLDRLVHLYSVGLLKVALDPKRFLGLQSVADAVEHLHFGKVLAR